MSVIDEGFEPTCLDADDPDEACSGKVEYRMALSATGKSYPRCDRHWEERLNEQDRINATYGPDSDVPPDWFDPFDAGERWDEEY